MRRPLSLDCIRCNCDRRNYAHKLWRVARTAVQNRVLQVPRRIAHYVGVSEFSLKVLRPHLPATVPVTVVRNPLECVDAGPAATGSNGNFVFIGRFEKEKGVRLFAEAARATGLPAVFIGDGSLAPELRQMCPDAQFTGWIGANAIRAHLRSALALVFPPLWYETLGLVVVEAAEELRADELAAVLDAANHSSRAVILRVPGKWSSAASTSARPTPFPRAPGRVAVGPM